MINCGDSYACTKTISFTSIKRIRISTHSALFNQQTIAAVLSCSTQLLERNRWAGGGVPYMKIGRKVLYRKSEVLNFLQQQKVYHSTSDEGQL